MKTQTFGINGAFARIDEDTWIDSSSSPTLLSFSCGTALYISINAYTRTEGFRIIGGGFSGTQSVPSAPLMRRTLASRLAVIDFINKRGNGSRTDDPRRPFPVVHDTDYTWTKGELRSDGYVYGVKNRKYEREYYEYEVRYNPSADVLAWMEEKDCNYLTRLVKEKTLRQQEPGVWFLWTKECDQKTDIAVWWKKTLHRFFLDSVLKQAEKDAKDSPLARVFAVRDCLRPLTMATPSTSRIDLNILGFKLDTECWQEVAKTLATVPAISKVDLSNTGLDEATWEILLQSLASNINLTTIPHINSTGNSLNFGAFHALQSLAKKKLTQFANLPAQCTLALTMLLKNPALTELNLSNHTLTSEHISLICQIITTCPNLRAVNLSNTHLSITDAQALLVALRQNRSITRLDISDNELPKSLLLSLRTQLWHNGGQLIGADEVLLHPAAPSVLLHIASSSDLSEHPAQTLIEQLLTTIASKDLSALRSLIQTEPRLLTCIINPQAALQTQIDPLAAPSATPQPAPPAQTTMLSEVCHNGDAAMVEFSLAQLGDAFWQLPEVLLDNGESLFRITAINLGLEAALKIAEQLGWRCSELSVQLSAIDKMTSADMAMPERTRLAYVCLRLLLRDLKLDEAALIGVMAQQIHDPALVIEVLKLTQAEHDLNFMRATTVAKDSNQQIALAHIAQQQDDAVFLELCSTLNFSPDDFYAAIAIANINGWTAAHLSARHRQAPVMQYLLKTLSPAQISQLLPRKTKEGDTLLNLVARHQDRETFMHLLAIASPESLRAALGNQPPSAELQHIIVERHSQAALDLLLAKYNLLDNCRKLQSEATKALQIFTNGAFTHEWAQQDTALRQIWQQLQPHFASVLAPSEDYQVVQQLKDSWEQLAPLQILLDALHDESKMQITKEVQPQLTHMFAQIFSTSPTFMWQWQLPPAVFEIVIAALRSLSLSSLTPEASSASASTSSSASAPPMITTRQFTWVQVALDPTQWNEFMHILSAIQPDLHIALPRSLNPKLSFNYPNLSELDVSDNDLGGSVAMLDSLVTQLAGHTQLHSLKLNNCGLGLVNGSFCKVAALLHKLPALTHLELRGINFSGSSDKHFATLLAYLQTNPTLVHLDLRECKLTPQQTSQLVAVLLERNRNLTTCLVDETVANTTARQQLKAVLERNQNKVQLESEYQAIVRNHQEFSQTVQDLKLDQEIRQLLDFARQAEQHYRDYHATLLGFAAHNYPSPSMVDNLYADHRQNGIWLIRLLANIINKEPNLRLLASHYAQVERLRREFIPDSQPDVQTALCELNSNYAARLLSAQNAQDFRQAVMFLNETPRELLSPEVISLLQKSCAVYAASCTASISAAPNLTYAIEAYYQLLSLVNSAAILLCDEKVELNLRRNTYSQLAQLIIQHCRAEGCTLATCSQLFQLLHGVTRYNRNTPEINQALALLTKNYVLHLLRSLQQSSGRLFGLTQKDVAALMAQVQALTTPDIARVLEITKAFCTKWQGEARKYAALREMAAIVTAVERYMPNDKECRGDTDSVSCSSPAATKAVAASSFAPPMPGAFAASAPPISKMSDEPDDDKAPPSKGTTAEKGEPGKQSKQSTDQLPFPLQAAAPLQLGFFAQQGQGGAQFTAPSAPPLLQSAEVSERNPIRELLDQCAREEIDLSDAPKKLIDPISLEIMTEPVKIQSGRTYEKSKIVEYLKTYDTDLIDRTKITDKKIIIPDWDKQSDIMEYLETKIRQHKQASKPSKQ